jgi:hypothetical protein
MPLRNASTRTVLKTDRPAFYLEAGQHRHFTLAHDGHRAVGEQPTWDMRLAPGERHIRLIVIDLPISTTQPGLGITEGTGAGPCIVGDEQSLLPTQTEIQLNT